MLHRTLRNNNSSRFGRFVKLDVAPTGGIHGGLINNYMLELSRIEFQAEGERNYHIFYQMIKGLSPEQKTLCALKNAEQYDFLNKSGCYEVETVNDLKEFADVRKQLECVHKLIAAAAAAAAEQNLYQQLFKGFFRAAVTLSSKLQLVLLLLLLQGGEAATIRLL